MNPYEYPAGAYTKLDLSDTLDLVSATGVLMSWGTIIGGAAAEVVIFRRPSAGATYFSQAVPIGAVVRLAGFDFKDGLEVITASAAGDVAVTLAIASL